MLREQCKVGMTVSFGRTHGERTVGVVEKMNPKKAKVRAAASRGSTPAGTIWHVPYSMMTVADDQVRPPATAFPLGLTITRVRPLTAAEAEPEGWGSDHVICVELSDGSVIYAARDYEGNGPGALFGRRKTGEHFTVG